MIFTHNSETGKKTYDTEIECLQITRCPVCLEKHIKMFHKCILAVRVNLNVNF